MEAKMKSPFAHVLNQMDTSSLYALFRGLPVRFSKQADSLGVEILYQHRSIRRQICSQNLDQEGIVQDTIEWLYREMFYFEGVPYHVKANQSGKVQEVSLGCGKKKLTTVINIEEDIQDCLRRLKQRLKSKNFEGKPDETQE